MDASQKIDFDDCWIDIEKTIAALLTGNSVSRTDWNDRVLDVYRLCLHSRLKLGEKLYRKIRTFLRNYVTQVQEVVYSVGAGDFHRQYEAYWVPFHTSARYLDHLFSFLNSCVIRKHRVHSGNVIYDPFGAKQEDDEDDEMIEIGKLAFDLWCEALVKMHQETLTESLLTEVRRDRERHSVDHRSVRSVVFSLVELLQLRPELDSLKLYEEVFEVPFFQMSTDYYIQTSQRFLDASDCSEFMKRVLSFTEEEKARSRRFLHPDSYNRVIYDTRQHLLIYNIPYLNSHCRDMVQQENWEDLYNAYHLLCPFNCPVENSLDTLISEFEEHVQEMGLAIMQSLQGDDLANQFVEAILGFLSHYTEKVQIVFQYNQRFLAALDRACTTAINFKRHPRATCRSPELLAKYCDDLLKKNTKGMTENEVDERLSDIIRLFNYISDKDVFQKFYSRGMARRLIFGLFQSMELEESMINRLKQVCGYEYTSKLHRMFTDMAVSSDLTAKFSDYLSIDRERQLSHNFFINVLADGSWPISHSDLPTFSLPQELEKCIRMFELFYNEQFCGRKLTWMYNLSLVELKFCYCKKRYLVTMEMYLMGILLCFNSADKIHYRDIRESCQLPNKELLKQLQLLVEAKILLASLPITDVSEFSLNLKFTNKRTKFKILPVIPAEVVQEVVQTHISVEEDRRTFMEASIVRIMKARKEMSHSALLQEVINQAKTRFVPKVSTIKKCIEMLIERQYIERSQKTQGSYVYIA